jgi:1-deoxy-D-xylulose-5-phosphate reductoisomerase
MKKKIAVFGSTGSIGTQTLDVVGSRPEEFTVSALAAGKNIDLLEQQIRHFRPDLVAVGDQAAARRLQERTADLGLSVLVGTLGLRKLAVEAEYDTMVMALVGNMGLEPVMVALNRGCQIAIATKEVLVAAGELVMERARQTGSLLLPVDSEHSAVFQCLQGEDLKTVEQIILTASGGPFRRMTCAELANVSPQQALRHPNWQMGPKITIDSATLINKGLEALEAHWLFSTPLDQIRVLVHPQSIIHSMVQFTDGAVMAQLGLPDMRGPIQYALMYPQRGHQPS